MLTKNRLLFVLPFTLSSLVSGCGTIKAPLAIAFPATAASNNWGVQGVYRSGQGFYPYQFGGSLLKASGQLSGVFHVDSPCFSSGVTDVPVTGVVDANNHLSLHSSTIQDQFLTLEGVLSADGSMLTNVNFSVTGGCSGNTFSYTGPDGPGAYISPTAVQIPSLSGTWVPVPGPFPLGVTEQLVQAAKPDVHGRFTLTGTVSVQGSPCFTHGTLEPGSYVSGFDGEQVILFDDGSTLNTPLQIAFLTQSTLLLHMFPGSLTGGQCNGTTDINLQSPGPNP